MDTDDPTPPNPWSPTTDMLELALLGKILEEAGELVEVCSPWDGTNVPLEHEIADVRAMVKLAEKHYGLNDCRTVRFDSGIKSLARYTGRMIEVVGRSIIQGIDSIDPGTEYTNRYRMEVAFNAFWLVSDTTIVELNLDRAEIDRRMEIKMAHKSKWHDMIRSGQIHNPLLREAKEALKPFATAKMDASEPDRIVDWPSAHDSDGINIIWDPELDDATLTIGQFKRAKEVYEKLS